MAATLMGRLSRHLHRRSATRVTLEQAVVEGPEKAEQREVYRLYVALGCEVIWFSQPRETMQTPGIPDLKVYCRRKRLTWWMECKAVGGVQSEAQRRFQELAESCGERYVLGGWDAAVEAAKAFGLVAPGWEPVPWRT